jgi:hypothetical protein
VNPLMRNSKSIEETTTSTTRASGEYPNGKSVGPSWPIFSSHPRACTSHCAVLDLDKAAIRQMLVTRVLLENEKTCQLVR